MDKLELINIQTEENNYKICEACGNELTEDRCKLKCKRCNYFRSCSDLF